MYRLHRGIMASGDGLEAAVRSFGPAAWYQPGIGVTGTLTASNWADQSGNGRDLAQGTAGNQPIYLPYSGTAYGWMPGIAGNDFRSNVSPALVNLDVRFQIALNTYPAAFVMTIASQYNATGNQKSWSLDTDSAGNISFGVSVDGSAYASNAIGTTPLASGYTGGTAYWFRVTRLDSTGALALYGSSDYDPLNINSGTWTSLGTGTSTSGALFDSTQNVEIGNYTAGSGLQPFLGKNFRTQIVSGGALVVDFNPSTFSETSTNGATATASTGEVWTLNSTGAKPAQIVKSASFLGDGTDDFMQTAGFTLDQPFTRFIVARQITWTAGDYLASGTAGAAGITQVTGTPKIGLNAGSGVADNTGAVLGSKVIIAAVFNGANSSLQVNAATATTGDAGAGNPGGLSILSDNAGANSGNWQIYEDITFAGAKAAAEIATVRNYLTAAHRIAL